MNPIPEYLRKIEKALAAGNATEHTYRPALQTLIESIEIFHTLKEAQVLIERWRLEYNTFRPHSSLNNRPPAPEAWLH